MNDKLVKDVMTPLDKVYMLSLDTVLDERKLREVRPIIIVSLLLWYMTVVITYMYYFWEFNIETIISAYTVTN